jgi:hypothetical protein
VAAKLKIGVTLLLVVVGATVVFAQVGAVPTIKTPPLSESDVFFLRIPPHDPTQPPIPHWAGSYLKIHVKDNTEADIVGLKKPFGSGSLVDPLGERSANVQSVPRTFTFTHPAGPQSGITLPASQPLWTITLHAKNTTPVNNSDIDYTVMWRNILHLVPQPEPTSFIRIPASWSIFALSTWNASSNRLPEPIPLEFQLGQWKHLDHPLTVHVTGFHGSNFIRSPWNMVNLGIEHVPEPMSTAVWLGGGLFCLAMGCWTRRRRQLAA